MTIPQPPAPTPAHIAALSDLYREEAQRHQALRNRVFVALARIEAKRDVLATASTNTQEQERQILADALAQAYTYAAALVCAALTGVDQVEPAVAGDQVEPDAAGDQVEPDAAGDDDGGPELDDDDGYYCDNPDCGAGPFFIFHASSGPAPDHDSGWTCPRCGAFNAFDE